MIGAGDLDRRIELQSVTTTTDLISNEDIETLATYATVSAKVEFHRADESEASAREYASMALFFTVRWRSDLSYKDSIIFEGETYEVIGRPREIGRRQFLKMEARLVE